MCALIFRLLGVPLINLRSHSFNPPCKAPIGNLQVVESDNYCRSKSAFGIQPSQNQFLSQSLQALLPEKGNCFGQSCSFNKFCNSSNCFLRSRISFSTLVLSSSICVVSWWIEKLMKKSKKVVQCCWDNG